jgi:transposase-like protein
MFVFRGTGPEKGTRMTRKRHTAEDIINQLRKAEVALAKGMAVPEVCRKLDVTEQTYYRWRKEYGGLRLDREKRLRELERENARLKKHVADISLDNATLKEVAQGIFRLRRGQPP